MKIIEFCLIALIVLASGCGGTKPVLGDVKMDAKSGCACRWRVETYPNDGYIQFIRFNDDAATSIDAIATVQVTTLANHKAATTRLIAIANESLKPGVWPKTGVPWPTLVRDYEAAVEGPNRKRMGPIEGLTPALTWARASNNHVIRVEGRARPGHAAALQDLQRLINTMDPLDPPSPAGVLATEVKELEATAKRTQPVLR